MRIDLTHVATLPLVSDSDVMHLALQVMMVCLKLSAPILLTSLVIGFAVSLFQSVTHIQEPTLSFVPKVVGVGVVLLFSGNWMMHTMISFTEHLFDQIPALLG
jgi:flagellar biosynthetic protein FliQ